MQALIYARVSTIKSLGLCSQDSIYKTKKDEKKCLLDGEPHTARQHTKGKH